MFITTTPILNSIEIKQYIGPLTANIVLGVNFFSELAASFTDVFGGTSGTYQSKFDELNNEVCKLIKSKAQRIGANAIIDYKIQFNEISGKGKQMFMVTATGTACVINKTMQETTIDNGQVTYNQILRQYFIALYQQLLKDPQYAVTDNDWGKIISYNLIELLTKLTSEFLRLNQLMREGNAFNSQDYIYFFSDKYIEFISRIDRKIVSQTLYSFLDSYPELVVPLIIKHNLFDAKEVIKQLEHNNLCIALELIKSHKDLYTTDDLSDMIKITHLLDLIPDKGKIQLVKSGMFSKKEEEMYICPNGHKNDKDQYYCANTNCGLNIRGLTIAQEQCITEFKRLTEALKTIIN